MINLKHFIQRKRKRGKNGARWVEGGREGGEGARTEEEEKGMGFEKMEVEGKGGKEKGCV